MGATMATVSALLKEIYEGPLREQLKQEVTTLRRIERTSEGVTSDVGGKNVVFPVHVGRNQGIGARLEMEALPTPGNQSTKAARVGLRYLYGLIRLSGPSLKLANTNEQAFMSVLDLEMNGLKTDLATDLNRQVYGYGTGQLTAIVTGATATTFVVNNTNWLVSQIGAVVDIYDSTGTTQKAAARTITATNDTTPSITISGAALTLVAGDIVVRTGSIGAADLSTQREWTGFGAITSSVSTLYGLTDPTWTANILNNSGTPRSVSENLITLACDTVVKRGNGNPTAMFMNLGVRRAYASLLMQQRRYTGTTEFKGGFSGIAFTTDNGDIPMVVDTHMYPNTILGITENQIKIYRENDWSFMDEDGSKWFRVPGYDAYDATMYQYSELGTHKRNAHFILSDLIEA